MPTKYILELRNKTTLWVTEAQADIIDKAWAARQPVTVNGNKINTLDLVGIWSEATWYENHPEARAKIPPHAQLLPPAKAETPYRKMWWEVLRRNRDLLAAGQKIQWTVEEGQIVKR